MNSASAIMHQFWRRFGWIPGRKPDRRVPVQGQALFRGLRLQLTLWYSGVLAVALLACGVVLYFGLQDLMLRPVALFLQTRADFAVQEWQRSPEGPCGESRARFPLSARRTGPLPIYIACLDPHGTILGTLPLAREGDASMPEAFLQRPLVDRALRDGTATDIVDGGEEVGPVYRLAVAVLGTESGTPLGVVQVGVSIAVQAETAGALRDLLFLIAVVAMLGAVAGGLMLAERALQPARLAFSRQQTFISDAAHELRAPLTLLRADAELLLRHRERLDADDAELLEDVVAEVGHMDRLASNLLALARLDAGRVHLELDVLDLSDLAAGIAQRGRALAKEKDLAIREEYPGEVTLFGDRQAVEQAALILLENAIKYTPAGGQITLRTSATDGTASLVVEDTGVGITPEHLRRLGERFYRADAARSPDASDGAGLGLAIAFGIAAAHNGTLHFESEPHQGTRAELILPSARAPHSR